MQFEGERFAIARQNSNKCGELQSNGDFTGFFTVFWPFLGQVPDLI